jgi:preprotein translocase subunit SecY
MGRGKRTTRQFLRLQAAVGIVLCSLVAVTLVVIGVVRAASDAPQGGSGLGFLILVAILLFGGTFICWHRFRVLSRLDVSPADRTDASSQ